MIDPSERPGHGPADPDGYLIEQAPGWLQVDVPR